MELALLLSAHIFVSGSAADVALPPLHASSLQGLNLSPFLFSAPPTHMPTAGGCEDGTHLCDTVSTYCHHDALFANTEYMCVCEEGFVPDPESMTSCLATPSPTPVPTAAPSPAPPTPVPTTPTPSPTAPTMQPTHLPTAMPCTDGSHLCDTLSTYCTHSTVQFSYSPYMCICLEGFRPDPTDITQCIATPAPTLTPTTASPTALNQVLTPTHMPTFDQCADGSHGCETESSYCTAAIEGIYGEGAYVCICREGYVADPSSINSCAREGGTVEEGASEGAGSGNGSGIGIWSAKGEEGDEEVIAVEPAVVMNSFSLADGEGSYAGLVGGGGSAAKGSEGEEDDEMMSVATMRVYLRRRSLGGSDSEGEGNGEEAAPLLDQQKQDAFGEAFIASLGAFGVKVNEFSLTSTSTRRRLPSDSAGGAGNEEDATQQDAVIGDGGIDDEEEAKGSGFGSGSGLDAAGANPTADVDYSDTYLHAAVADQDAEVELEVAIVLPAGDGVVFKELMNDHDQLSSLTRLLRSALVGKGVLVEQHANDGTDAQAATAVNDVHIDPDSLVVEVLPATLDKVMPEDEGAQSTEGVGAEEIAAAVEADAGAQAKAEGEANGSEGGDASDKSETPVPAAATALRRALRGGIWSFLGL